MPQRLAESRSRTIRRVASDQGRIQAGSQITKGDAAINGRGDGLLLSKVGFRRGRFCADSVLTGSLIFTGERSQPAYPRGNLFRGNTESRLLMSRVGFRRGRRYSEESSHVWHIHRVAYKQSRF